MKSIGVVILIVLALTATVFIGSWASAIIGVFTPNNVQSQYALSYSDYKSLKATAQNACAAQKLVDSETNPEAKSQRESQLEAYEQNYRRIQADYESHTADAFAAKHVLPADLPHQAPDLQDMEKEVCV